MLTSLKIKGYRTFQSFDVEDINQVNLIVGTNNCGKTTVLEAATTLLDISNPLSIIRSSLRRGEVNFSGKQRSGREIDISHLFHGHHCVIGSVIDISGQNDGIHSFHAEIIESAKPTPLPMFDEKGEQYTDTSFSVLSVKNTGLKDGIEFPLYVSGTIIYDNLMNLPFHQNGRNVSQKKPPVFSIPSESLNSSDMSELWDAIALTPDEDKIIDVLKILEPEVERVAFLSSSPNLRSGSQGGIYVKIHGHDDRIPLGSFGDGMRRLMALAMGLIRSSGGSVMIDEIDTGLHYTAMQDMWRMVIQTARNLSVQVFATTHSKDCIEALGALHNIDSQLCESVRVHRIEKGYDKTITFHPEELATTVKIHGEIR